MGLDRLDRLGVMEGGREGRGGEGSGLLNDKGRSQ